MRLASQIGLTALALSALSMNAGAENSLPAAGATLSHLSLVSIAHAAASPAVFDEGRLSSLVRGVVRGTAKIDVQLNCMAKVVYHEARDEDLVSQLAVAEVVENRTRTDGFPKTACSVVNQRGQFFDAANYAVPAGSDKWRTAVAIARIAHRRAAPAVTDGALFYHAADVAPSWRRDHLKVAEVGGNIFYK